MTATNSTIVATIHRQIKTDMERVCEILSFDQLQYCQFQYLTGLDFIKAYYPEGYLQNAIERSKTFWSWWKLKWMNRDYVFLHSDIERQELSMRYRYFSALNDVSILRNELIPIPAILKEAMRLLEHPLFRDL